MDWEIFLDQVHKLLHNIFLMFMGVLVFFTFMYFVDTGMDPARFIGNMMNLANYKMVAITHLNDNVSIRISDFCNPLPLDKQPECVVYQVLPFYNYSMHNNTVYSPDEYVIKGGVCRDSSVLYHSIFTRMGWYVYYDFSIPHHVFLTITKTGKDYTMRCVIDSLAYNCEKYGGV